ncbi:MAG: 4Fe-4S binding protein [Caldisericota bacterium]|jgi:2-oxoglutarate ferredoxin oxidoreductase subunit delta|nr:4Fe-4S binding protein [Caldisericota bacterium]
MPDRKTYKIAHVRKWCKDCGICVAVCPRKVFEIDRNDRQAIVNPQDCIGCQMCVEHCPDFALNVTEDKSDA